MEKKSLKRKLPSILRWVLWVLLAQFILFNISASLYAYKLSHFYNDSSLRNATPSQNVFTKTWRLFSGPRLPKSVVSHSPSFTFDTVTFKTASGIFIDAWYAQTDSISKGTVILFHGVTVNKQDVMTEAGEFRFLGYNVLMVDFRAHGNSGGNTTTIGVREAEEIKLAYDYILKAGEKKIILWGSSMGAVTIAKAVADYELKPAGVILEMPFASLQDHLKARARMIGFSGFPEKPFGLFVTLWMGIERGFNGFKHQTTRYVKQIKCPVLLQWGALDIYVMKTETDRIYSNISSPDKKLVIYDHANHESFAENDPLKWRIEVGRFLSSSVK
jgi:alpha-beta hydrolase superfamily lysophospholipase